MRLKCRTLYTPVNECLKELFDKKEDINLEVIEFNKLSSIVYSDLDKVYNRLLHSFTSYLRCKNRLQQPPKLKFTWKNVLLPLLGILCFFIYIYLYKVDVLGIIDIARNANPLIYSIAILFGFLEVFFFTISWRELTRYLSIKISVFRAYLYVWYGIYIDTIVPAQSVSGEVTRTYLCQRDKCGPFGKVVASLFMHRLLGTILNVVGLIAGIVFLFLEGQAGTLIFNAVIVVAAVIAAVIVLMLVLSVKQRWTLKLIDWGTNFTHKISRGKINFQKYREQAVEITSHFHDSMKEFIHKPKALTTSLIFLLISWFFSLAVPYLVFQSLGHPVTWSMIVVTSAIVLAVKAIPVGIPFEVGLPEAVMTTLYISMGIPGSLAATATILIRIITLWIRFIVGFVSQQYIELTPPLNNGEDTEKPKITPITN
jgi:glycosyltransferase 2 family protein